MKELLEAHADVITARQAVEQAHYDSFLQAVDLLVAMGRFDATSLELEVVHYDPAEYLNEIMALPLGIGLE